MARLSGFPVRALRLAAVLLPMCVPGDARAQVARPPQNRPVPHSTDPSLPRRDTTPFRELDIEGTRIEFLALNDEACPLQIQSGRVVKAQSGQQVVAVEVKSLSETPLNSFVLAALVFDATGAYKADRSAGTGGPLPQRQLRRVDLTLNGSAFAAGDRVVLAVKETRWTDGGWRSIPDEVRAAAREAVQQDIGRTQ